MALLGRFDRRSKSSGFRREADEERTSSERPRLTQSQHRPLVAPPSQCSSERNSSAAATNPFAGLIWLFPRENFDNLSERHRPVEVITLYFIAAGVHRA